MCKLEKRAVDDRTLYNLVEAEDFVTEMRFPSLTWVREILIQLFEVHFQYVPKWVYDDVLDFG